MSPHNFIMIKYFGTILYMHFCHEAKKVIPLSGRMQQINIKKKIIIKLHNLYLKQLEQHTGKKNCVLTNNLKIFIIFLITYN